MRLVLGTADLCDEPLTLRLLDHFYDAGGRAIDVANVYEATGKLNEASPSGYVPVAFEMRSPSTARGAILPIAVPSSSAPR